MEPFDAISPLDARYILPDEGMRRRVDPYLSEAASIRYQLRQWLHTEPRRRPCSAALCAPYTSSRTPMACGS